ncbi:MAG: glutathione peroxidase [Cyclobacteriaceae bacterium]|nr:MAG: glutathione peroxidase [Cyclobacteriaceae bacterium]
MFKALFFLSTFIMPALNSSIYDYKIEALNSNEVIDLSMHRGKMMLLVNVASKCGYTPQYQDLQKLYETYQDKLVIIGFPCNQFLFQESGSEEQIAQFCQTNYGVTFPMTTKIKVKGANKHPIYRWLTSEKLNGVGDYAVSWNFNKFLIDENGRLIGFYKSSVAPFSEEIISHLK